MCCKDKKIHLSKKKNAGKNTGLPDEEFLGDHKKHGFDPSLYGGYVGKGCSKCFFFSIRENYRIVFGFLGKKISNAGGKD